MWICENCGTKNYDDAVICINCGVAKSTYPKGTQMVFASFEGKVRDTSRWQSPSKEEEIRNVLTAIVICVLGSSLFSWLAYGILYIAFIIGWGIWLLFLSYIFWVILGMLLKAIGREKEEIHRIPYPLNVLVIVAGGTILVIISLIISWLIYPFIQQ